MRDEQVGQPHLLLQILKHVDDLCLNGNVQCRDRLVADDKLRVHSQCTGNADALTLTAGKLVRITVCVFAVQAHTLQQSNDLVMAILGILCQMMDVDALAHDITNGHTGVKARIRILEHDLHTAAVRQHVHCNVVLLVEQHLAVIDDLAVGRLVQAQQAAAGRGLAAAGLTDQTQRFALADRKADIVHSLNELFLLAHAAGGEILLQVLDFYQRILFTHSAFSPFSNAAFCWSQQ